MKFYLLDILILCTPLYHPIFYHYIIFIILVSPRYKYECKTRLMEIRSVEIFPRHVSKNRTILAPSLQPFFPLHHIFLFEAEGEFLPSPPRIAFHLKSRGILGNSLSISFSRATTFNAPHRAVFLCNFM